MQFKNHVRPKDMATEIEHKAAELKNNETIGGLSKCHVDRRSQGVWIFRSVK